MVRLSIAITFVFSFCLLFSGCASSRVSRDVASNIDVGVRHTQDLFDESTDGHIADSYQNSSQATKGAIIGGTVGAVAGYSSGVGIIPGTAVGAILGASYGKYIDSNTTMVDRLENRGISIIVLGDQVLIVIPSSRIFNGPHSSVIKPEARSTLAMIVRFINCYIKTSVKVTAYTQGTGSPKVDLALTKQQAQRVVRFLIDCGLNARLVYAEGCGSSHLVQRLSEDWYGNDNFRIEITFEKLYA